MRLLKNTRYLIFGIALLLIEQIFGKYIAIFGAVPMLTFSFCTASAMIVNDFDAAVFLPALFGALCDILSGHGFGTYTLTFAAAAAVTHVSHNRLFSSELLFLVCDMIIMTILAQSFYFLVHINEIGSDFKIGFVSIILPMAVYNSLAAVLLYRPAKRLLERR